MSSFSKQLTITSAAITESGASFGATYDIPLGNPTLYTEEMIGFFTMSGSVTLTTSLAITTTYTPAAPVKFVFVSRGSYTLGANSFTIFGRSLSAVEALNPFVLTAWYDGSAWQAVLSRTEIPTDGLDIDDIEAIPAETFLMNSGTSSLSPQAVTYANVRSELGVDFDVIPLVVDFNSGHINRQDLLLPYKGEVVDIIGFITQNIDSSDNGTVDVGVAGSLGGGYSSMSTLTFNAGASKGTGVTDSPTLANTFNAGNYLVVDPNKVTWGGRVLFSFKVKRT